MPKPHPFTTLTAESKVKELYPSLTDTLLKTGLSIHSDYRNVYIDNFPFLVCDSENTALDTASILSLEMPLLSLYQHEAF